MYVNLIEGICATMQIEPVGSSIDTKINEYNNTEVLMIKVEIQNNEQLRMYWWQAKAILNSWVIMVFVPAHSIVGNEMGFALPKLMYICITECGSNSVYGDWAGVKWRPVHKVWEHVCKLWSKVQPKQFRQISITCLLWSYPWSLSNLSCSRKIPLQKSPFCPFFFLLSFLSAITC